MKTKQAALTNAIKKAITCSGICFFMATSPTTMAQSTGTITGTVVDGGNRSLEGAILLIPSLNLRATTDREGRYRFAGVEAGKYEVIVEYQGYETERLIVVVESGMLVTENARLAPEEGFEIIDVRGSRFAQQSALNQERAADTLKSVIASADAGKFADQNIAETLQRLPGISIERSDGEGRFVSVRGLGPNFTNVTLNGARVPSTETGANRDRAVALDTIPSELLENLEVSKTVTPDNDGDTIGGTVSIRSLSAFQRDGQFVSYKVEGNRDQRSGDNGYKTSLTYSNLFADNTFGVALSISAQERNYLIENVEGDNDDDAIAESEDGNGFVTNVEPNARTLDLTREREAASLSLDFRPKDGGEYYFRGTYSNLFEAEQRNRKRFFLDRGDIFLTANNTGATEELRVRTELRDQDEDQTIYTLNLGGRNLTDNWDIDYSVSYSNSQRDELDNRLEFQGGDFEDAGGAVDDIQFDLGTEFFNLDLFGDAGAAYANRSEHEFRRFRRIVEFSEDENAEFQFNAERSTDWGSMKFGVKHIARTKRLDIGSNDFRDLSDEGESEIGSLANFDPLDADYTLGEFGPTTAVSPAIQQAIGILERGLLVEDDDEAEASVADSTLADYESDENVSSLYGMASYFWSEELTIIGGVRVEHTEFETQGVNFNESTNSFENVVAETDYTDVLPSITIRWDVHDEVVVRAGAYRSVVRPTFRRNNASISFNFDSGIPDDPSEEAEQSELIVEAGNPELEPFTATNFDFNIAWYPEDFVGVLQAGIFYKDIENFVFNTELNQDDVLGQQILARGGLTDLASQADIVRLVNVSVNGDAAEVLGLELTYQQQFDNGFSIGSNATFVDSEAQIDGRTISLIGQADLVGNLTIAWENEKWELRATANYNGDFLVALNNEDFEGNDAFTDARTQLDIGIKYRLTDYAQLYFDAINLTQEPEFIEYGRNGSGFVSQFQNIEQTFLVGIRGSL